MFEGKNNQVETTEQWRPLDGIDRECFGCGLENHHGLQMRFETDGDRLRSTLVLEKRFRGWSNLIHGGILSTILDESMGRTVLCLTGKFTLTKGMQIWFRKPVRIGMKLTVTSFIKERLSERKVVVVAEIHDESGTLCASSEGEFSLFTREEFLRMEIVPEEDIDAMLLAPC